MNLKNNKSDNLPNDSSTGLSTDSHTGPPDFFEEKPLDPINVASGFSRSINEKTAGKPPMPEKRKAGFYLTEKIIERFNRKFYELKLEGVAIENKSALLEKALTFALDDLDKGENSKVMSTI